MENKVQFVIDGRCEDGAPVCGWAVVLSMGNNRRALSGFTDRPDRLRANMFALTQGLKALTRGTSIRVYTRSDEMVNGFNKALPQWKRNHQLASKENPIDNADLWIEIDQLAEKHKIEIVLDALAVENSDAPKLAVAGESAGLEKCMSAPKPSAATVENHVGESPLPPIKTEPDAMKSMEPLLALLNALDILLAKDGQRFSFAPIKGLIKDAQRYEALRQCKPEFSQGKTDADFDVMADQLVASLKTRKTAA